ncbi:MAG: septal ring lytic transglycosylase RlpA family protein [Gammaproteobacteria bacterium]|nr:MAG: septal ring lytic transglycosylase RlpA family protein [Gammaproteobacteria bacterium]
MSPCTRGCTGPARRWRGCLLPGLLLLVLLLPGCGMVEVQDGLPQAPRDVSGIPDAVPRAEPRSRYGNPESYEVLGHRYYVMQDARGYVERGIASWYGTKFHGRRTSSGEPYDMYRMTAAHKTLPLPTYVQVTNLRNGRSVVVRVNDRGPFHDNRIIDLSYAAALKLGMIDTGTAPVEVRALEPGRPRPQVASIRPHPGLQYHVQVGAFHERTNAERLQQRLSRLLQVAVSIREARVEGRPLYRVLLGPLPGVAASDRLIESLKSLGIEEHHLVFN